MLNDFPVHRGNFIKSEKTGGVAYLDDSGKMFLMNEKIQRAIEKLFDEIANPWKPGEVIATIPAQQPRPVIPILAYVESVERLVRALRA